MTCWGALVAAHVIASTTVALAGNSTSAPTPRELYNEGTQHLQSGKLREAEAALQMAVAANRDEVQSPGLYNLGLARYRQGLQALKDGPSKANADARGSAAGATGDQALRAADAALVSNEVQAIVNAYMQGRGARKDLKGAVEAVKRAMEQYGAVLRRWERSSGDFKSAAELRPSDDKARTNAANVDAAIAKLVDQLNQMQQMMQALGKQREELKEKMKQLKGKLPEGMQPQGESGDDDEEEEQKEPQKGHEEGPSRDGQKQLISPEDAARLLETLKLDANRKLPIGDGDPTKPKNRTGKTW